MLFSIHIPKCGGTSFRVYLERIFGERLLIDYSRRWERKDLDVLLPMLEGKECFHAHAASDLFDGIFEDVTKITWVRNPLDRIVSYFGHIQREKDYSNDYFRRVLESGMDVVEFSKQAWVSNGILRYLGGGVTSFRFVGIIEDPMRSLIRLERVLGRGKLHDAMPQLNSMKEHQGDKGSLRLMSREDRCEMARANKLDLRFYARQCELYGCEFSDNALLTKG